MVRFLGGFGCGLPPKCDCGGFGGGVRSNLLLLLLALLLVLSSASVMTSLVAKSDFAWTGKFGFGFNAEEDVERAACCLRVNSIVILKGKHCKHTIWWVEKLIN